MRNSLLLLICFQFILCLMPKRIRIWGWFQLKEKKKPPGGQKTWMAKSASYPIPHQKGCSSALLESSSSGILGSQSKRGNTTKSVYIYIYTLPHIHILYAIQELWLPWWFSGKESTCQCRRLIQSLVWEDPPSCRATQPIIYSSWACPLEPGNCSCWAHVPVLLVS